MTLINCHDDFTRQPSFGGSGPPFLAPSLSRTVEGAVVSVPISFFIVDNRGWKDGLVGKVLAWRIRVPSPEPVQKSLAWWFVLVTQALKRWRQEDSWGPAGLARSVRCRLGRPVFKNGGRPKYRGEGLGSASQ